MPLMSSLPYDVVHKATGEAFAKQIQALFTLAIGIGIGFSASWKVRADNDRETFDNLICYDVSL